MSEMAAQLPDDELMADLEEAMRDVVDPELGINVVDLGLVYGLNVERGEDGTVNGKFVYERLARERPYVRIHVTYYRHRYSDRGAFEVWMQCVSRAKNFLRE